jgi:hypothetical protein
MSALKHCAISHWATVRFCNGCSAGIHAGRSACMERIAITMQDGGAGAGARYEAAARAARPTSFCLAAEPLHGTPGRGDFSVSNFHPALIPGNLDENNFGVKEVAGAEVGWPVLGYLLGKNFRRNDDACGAKGRLIRCTVPGSTPNCLAMTRTPGRQEPPGPTPTRCATCALPFRAAITQRTRIASEFDRSIFWIS